MLLGIHEVLRQLCNGGVRCRSVFLMRSGHTTMLLSTSAVHGWLWINFMLTLACHVQRTSYQPPIGRCVLFEEIPEFALIPSTIVTNGPHLIFLGLRGFNPLSIDRPHQKCSVNSGFRATANWARLDLLDPKCSALLCVYTIYNSMHSGRILEQPQKSRGFQDFRFVLEYH